MRFIRRIFGSTPSPIGVDFGSASLKLAQLDGVGIGARLIAAADYDVPDDVARRPAARLQFFVSTIPELLSRGGFRGRRCVLGLPAASMHLERVRIPVLDAECSRQAIEHEASLRLPFHTSRALIRHVVAGEVYEGDQPRSEVIVMATRRQLIDELLTMARRAQLEVVGFNAEPIALTRCFSAEGRTTRSGLPPGALMIVDIGSSASRVYIVARGKILFARAVGIGAVQLDQSIADRLGIPLAEARAGRLELSRLRSAADGNSSTGVHKPLSEKLARAEHACLLTLRKLKAELELSTRYFHATFPSTHVEDVVFIGGAAGHARLCQVISEEVHLKYCAAASLAGIDMQGDNPILTAAWAVAVGLTLADLKQAA